MHLVNSPVLSVRPRPHLAPCWYLTAVFTFVRCVCLAAICWSKRISLHKHMYTSTRARLHYTAGILHKAICLPDAMVSLLFFIFLTLNITFFLCGTTAPSWPRLLDHTHRRTPTPGSTPLNIWSARHTGHYLHYTHQTQETRIYMPSAGFDATIPAIKCSQTDALDCTATGNVVNTDV